MPVLPSLLLLILACDDIPVRTPTDTGVGTGAPDGGCVEVSRTTLTDLDRAAAGFSFLPADALALATGSFTGTATLHDGSEELPEVDAWLSVAAPSTVDAVDMELDDSTSSGDTGPATGAPGADPAACRDFYQAQVSGSLRTADGALDEVWAGDLSLWEVGNAALSVSLDATDLGGAYTPDFDPSAYDTATLDVSATGSEEGWRGTMQWSASRELADGMGEGVVGPAGGFSVQR